MSCDELWSLLFSRGFPWRPQKGSEQTSPRQVGEAMPRPRTKENCRPTGPGETASQSVRQGMKAPASEVGRRFAESCLGVSWKTTSMWSARRHMSTLRQDQQVPAELAQQRQKSSFGTSDNKVTCASERSLASFLLCCSQGWSCLKAPGREAVHPLEIPQTFPVEDHTDRSALDPWEGKT